jgi:pimeloyl-ACP methyl ester carboxylesterase
MTEELEIRIHGPNSQPTLIYLPGLHGDWTLIGRFRRALGERVRFAEVTYPRTLTWTLDDYAQAVERALAENGVSHGWLLGESFSSQVVWPIVERRRFNLDAVILAGGFVRHPFIPGVRLAARVAGGVSLTLLTRILFGYARLIRARYGSTPEMLAEIESFIARRTDLDRQAAKHRLQLLARYDPCSVARQANVPIYALTGLVDPIVPWYWVRSWLRKNCPSLREYRVIWRADHNVLGSAAQESADQIVKWLHAQKGRN